MEYRYLFGPVTAAFADQKLAAARQAGRCLACNAEGTADLAITADDTWASVCARLPAGWRPDFVALYLPYTHVPGWMWSAPVPLVGLAADWNLLWHQYRKQLRRCDLVLTDTAGAEVMARDGIAHAWAWNLYGLDRVFLDGDWPDGPRDIDILFVGNLHPAVQRERLAWLGRLARLGARWHVVIRTGVFGEEYRWLLARARIVFNRSVRGEGNQRAFEAAAAGALLFQEAGNREVLTSFRDRMEYISYADDDLEELLEYYLTHEDERAALAAAARIRVQRCGFDALWAEMLSQIEEQWPALVERVAQRPVPSDHEALLGRVWQALGGGGDADPALAGDLEAALACAPSATLHHALGLATALTAADQRSAAAVAAPHFERALQADPGHLVAGLSLAEALALVGEPAAAATPAGPFRTTCV